MNSPAGAFTTIRVVDAGTSGLEGLSGAAGPLGRWLPSHEDGLLTGERFLTRDRARRGKDTIGSNFRQELDWHHGTRL